MSENEPPPRPALAVVRGGEPTQEEVAALVSALAVVGSAPPDDAPRGSRWADRAAGLRRPLERGQGSWVASARRVR